ncbi:alpha-N-acetylglucosaminidase-like [Watersipora subatra]|uniref:alpha-N-acetylglucosaminidase-like n=1 Tax=Watersipora subatra TaxID=2589382 RepID=UPI00355C82AC
MALILPVSLIAVIIAPLASGDYGLLNSIQSLSSSDQQKAAVEGLVTRYLPERKDEFVIEIDASLGPSNLDTFELATLADNRLKIVGSSGVAAALGFGSYLKEYGRCQVAWSDAQLNLSHPLPKVPVAQRRTSNDRFSYYSNVCTFGYTYVWWNWTRWQREIDWMAVNGINFPLAFVGQETILQRVFKRLGVSETQLEEWFTGPAFLPWFRMGNLVKWGGPLSLTYLSGQVQLQHQILKRMREFGMLPVLPAFAGHVPAAISQIFPTASITKLSLWSHFDGNYTGTYYLNPTDPLYPKIGHIYIEEYVSEFGTDHFYNIDPWNEMEPAESSVAYLSKASSAIMSSLRSHDPKAIWVLQGWMFSHNADFWTKERAKAFLTGVPKGEMIVLDLAAEYQPMYEKLDSFFGQPFLFCMINNYGGRMGLYGHMDSVSKNVFKARSFPNSTLIGTGLTMEGTGTNYITYELMNEMHVRRAPPDLYEWVGNYTSRRYGVENMNLQHAWTKILLTAYNCSDYGKELVIMRPRWKMRSTAFPAYNTSSLADSIDDVQKALQMSSVTSAASLLLRHDVVDLWREALYVLLCKFYDALQIDVQAGDIDHFRDIGGRFLELLDDLESLVGSHHSYLLGTWVNDAEQLATSEADKYLFRFNALNQVTLWGPNGEITDYAGKQWAGLIKQYYHKRWSMFLAYNEMALSKSIKFNQRMFEEDLFTFVEQPFGLSQQNFSASPKGNTFLLANELYTKYSSFIHDLF